MSAENLFSPDVLQDPYPLYHRLRAQAPVLWSDELGGWLVTGYDAANAVVRSPKVSMRGKGEVTARRFTDPGHQTLVANAARTMVTSDPPAHTRVRALASKAFTPGSVAAMRPRVERLVDTCLDRVRRAGRMDVIADFGGPLPVEVIVSMLGIPVADAPRFRAWSDALTVLHNWIGVPTPEQVQGVVRAVREFNEYLAPLVAARRAAPTGDLLSALVRAEEAGDTLTETEVYVNALLLLGAGHETTTNLIGNGTLALLRNPDQYRKLCADPSLVPHAVEELLRYDCPVQIDVRKALDDIPAAGEVIRTGQLIFLVWGAANRDPARFPDPDRLDVTRTDVKHLSFGAGIHFCLGAPLARLEAEIAFTGLVRNFPNLRLATDRLEYHDNFNLRGLKSLPVAF